MQQLAATAEAAAATARFSHETTVLDMWLAADTGCLIAAHRLEHICPEANFKVHRDRFVRAQLYDVSLSTRLCCCFAGATAATAVGMIVTCNSGPSGRQQCDVAEREKESYVAERKRERERERRLRVDWLAGWRC
jgi:hypothetical protein